MNSPTRLPIIVYALVLLMWMTFTVVASDDCFKQQGDRYTRPADGGNRISAGIACPDLTTPNCPLSWGGYLNAPSILNVTTRDNAKVFAAVGKAANTTLPTNPSAGPLAMGLSSSIPVRLAGVSNDTAIEACRPRMLDSDTPDGIPQFAGQGGFVTTNIESIANMTSNPAANTSPISANIATPISQAVQLAAPRIGLLMTILMTIMGLAGWLLT